MFSDRKGKERKNVKFFQTFSYESYLTFSRCVRRVTTKARFVQCILPYICVCVLYISRSSQGNKLSRSSTFFAATGKLFIPLFCAVDAQKAGRIFILALFYLLSRLAFGEVFSHHLSYFSPISFRQDESRRGVFVLSKGIYLYMCALHRSTTLMDACLQLPLTQSIHVVSKQISGKMKFPFPSPNKYMAK